jgi:hypothetical protein
MPVLPSFSQHVKNKFTNQGTYKSMQDLGSHSGVLEFEVVQEAFFDCLMLQTKTIPLHAVQYLLFKMALHRSRVLVVL